MKSFKPGQIVIRQLHPTSRYRSAPRWGIYIKNTKRYGEAGYVLLWSSNQNRFNSAPSPTTWRFLFSLTEASKEMLAVLPPNVYDKALTALEKEHPAYYNLFVNGGAMPITDMQEVPDDLEQKLIKNFQDSQKRLSLYRIFRNEEKNDLAELVASGEVSPERAEILHKLEDAHDDWKRSNEQTQSLWAVVAKYQAELDENAIAEGLKKPPRQKKHELVAIDQEVREDGTNRYIEYTCACGFVGSARTQQEWPGINELGKRAWRNFYRHEHRQAIKEMREEKAA